MDLVVDNLLEFIDLLVDKLLECKSPVVSKYIHSTAENGRSRVGAVVRALAPHQCAPSSIPGLHVICGLSLPVLYPVPRGFSPATPVSPFPQKEQTKLNKAEFNLILFDLYSVPN